MNRPDREVFGVDLALLAGVVAVLGAALVVVAPWLVPAVVVGTLAPLATEASVVFLAAVAGLLGLRTVYRGEPRSDRPGVDLPPPPAERERRREGGSRVAGQSLDELLDRIANPDRETRSIDRVIDKGQVRDAVRETALDVLVDAGGYTRETAEEVLDRGTWTDRPRAAAFLGDRSLPLEVRIVDWLSGEAFERQVRAAVGELAAVAGVETASGIAPDPVATGDGIFGGDRSPTASGAGRPTEDARSAARSADEFDRAGADRPAAGEPDPAVSGTGAVAASADRADLAGAGAAAGSDRPGTAATAQGTTAEAGAESTTEVETEPTAEAETESTGETETDPAAEAEPEPAVEAERTAAREGGSR